MAGPYIIEFGSPCALLLSGVALKLVKLGHMGETQSKVIKKLVNHAYTCDRWWLERDEELQL